MNSRSLTFLWLGSIAILSVLAGSSWRSIDLNELAGGARIEISGYLAFPVITALLLLQAAAFLATILTRPTVGKVISGVLVPVLTWHFLSVLWSIDQALQEAAALEIAKLTGVAGLASQTEFVVSMDQGPNWIFYLGAVAVNIVVLMLKTFSRGVSPKESKIQQAESDTTDLWESQK